MEKPKFVYVTYIATTPEKLWDALIKPEFTQRYWFGVRQESDWKVGSSWALVMPDGEAWDRGEVLEIEPKSRLVISWEHQRHQELREIGATRASFLLEPCGDVVKLTVTHEMPVGGEKFLEAVGRGWPQILSSLKSLLETGKELTIKTER